MSRVLACCPFCVSHDVQIRYPSDSEFFPYVECGQCGAKGPTGSTEREAEELWQAAKFRPAPELD